MINDDDTDDWGDEPEREYHNEAETCPHGIWICHDCEWCEEARNE